MEESKTGALEVQAGRWDFMQRCAASEYRVEKLDFGFAGGPGGYTRLELPTALEKEVKTIRR
jgi:hypothetical protein